MIDISQLPPDLLLARGKYATVRGDHEDEKKKMQVLCGTLGANAAQVLRAVQPDHDSIPDMELVSVLLSECRSTLKKMVECANEIQELAILRADLKPKAWPK